MRQFVCHSYRTDIGNTTSAWQTFAHAIEISLDIVPCSKVGKVRHICRDPFAPHYPVIGLAIYVNNVENQGGQSHNIYSLDPSRGAVPIHNLDDNALA